MILYYGADRNFAVPQYNYGNASNDYGQGFYMTPEEDKAALWASQYEIGGQLVCFELDTSKLKICELNSNKEEDIFRWISLLTQHRFSFTEREAYKTELEWLARNYPVNLAGYDMIVGYRADDSYFKYSRDFVANEISFELLSKAMRLGKLGLQYVLISLQSYNYIHELWRKEIPHSDAYDIFRNQTLQDYVKQKEQDDKINNPTIVDYMRKLK